MTRYILIAIAVLACHAAASAYSIPENQKYFAGLCVQEIINCRYSQALRLADSAALADTEDPLAPIIRLTVIGVRDVDLDTLLDSAGFIHSYETAVRRIALYEKRHGESSYTTMLSGFCKGLHASFYLRLESYFAAMQTGFDALKLLDKAYRLDSSNADALLFLGLYDYARGELRKKLWWVLFWYPGSKEQGIRRLRTCSNNGQLTSTAALLALVDISVREKKTAECLSIVNRLEKAFPQSRFVLWAKAKHLESAARNNEAASVFDLLASSYAAEPAGSYSELATRCRQAHLLSRAGRDQDAATICRAILPRARGNRNKLIYKDTEKLLRRIDDAEN
jgi:hypothetical protein